MVVFDGVSDSKALAAVRLIPLLLLVEGTAADCIISFSIFRSLLIYFFAMYTCFELVDS